MVKTRNQRAQTPNAVQLVSIPTVYRPSTRNGRWIVESMPGTTPQATNGESIRVTRTAIHLTPTPRSSRPPPPSTHSRFRATTASRDGCATEEIARERSSSPGLSEAETEVVEQSLVEPSGRPGPSSDVPEIGLEDPGQQLAGATNGRSPSVGVFAVGLDGASQEPHEDSMRSPVVSLGKQFQTSFEAVIGLSDPEFEREVFETIEDDDPGQVHLEQDATLPSRADDRADDHSSVAWGEFMADLENSIEPSNPIEVSAKHDMGNSDLPDLKQSNLPELSPDHAMGNSDPPEVEQSELVIPSPSQEETEPIEPATSPLASPSSGSLTDHLNEDIIMAGMEKPILDHVSTPSLPPYQPILSAKAIQELTIDGLTHRQHQELHDINYAVDNMRFHNEQQFSFNLREPEDTTLPSVLPYERHESGLAQWRQDLCLNPYDDPFLGNLQREVEWRGRVARCAPVVSRKPLLDLTGIRKREKD